MLICLLVLFSSSTIAATDQECLDLVNKIKADTLAVGKLVSEATSKINMTSTEILDYSEKFHALRTLVDEENVRWAKECTAPATGL